jgi:hypothetical protein
MSGRGRPLSYLACILVYITFYWDRVYCCSYIRLFWFTLAIESFSLITQIVGGHIFSLWRMVQVDIFLMYHGKLFF